MMPSSCKDTYTLLHGALEAEGDAGMLKLGDLRWGPCD